MVTTPDAFPAAVYGKPSDRSHTPHGYQMLAAHRRFDAEAKTAFERVAGSFGWRDHSFDGTHVPCFAVVPLTSGGQRVLVLRLLDIGEDDQGRPHCLRAEAALVENAPPAQRLAAWLQPAAWPESSMPIGPDPEVRLGAGAAPATADPSPAVRDVMPALDRRPMPALLVGDPTTFRAAPGLPIDICVNPTEGPSDDLRLEGAPPGPDRTAPRRAPLSQAPANAPRAPRRGQSRLAVAAALLIGLGIGGGGGYLLGDAPWRGVADDYGLSDPAELEKALAKGRRDAEELAEWDRHFPGSSPEAIQEQVQRLQQTRRELNQWHAVADRTAGTRSPAALEGLMHRIEEENDAATELLAFRRRVRDAVRTIKEDLSELDALLEPEDPPNAGDEP